MKVVLFLLVSFLFLCCSSTKVIYRIYNVEDPKPVIDSIVLSGTAISELVPFTYVNDDSVAVNVKIGSLYRDGKACGSIKIREENGIKVVSIIDQI